MHVLSLTGFFQWIAVRVAAAARGNAIAIFIVLAALSGLLSAFLDNVTCVMLMGPVTISLCRQMKVPPVPFYLTQTLTATIGGTATMVGDPPNVVIGNKLGLPFNAFMIYNGPLVVVFLLPTAIGLQYLRFRHGIPRLVNIDITRMKLEHRIVDQKALLYTSIGQCGPPIVPATPPLCPTHTQALITDPSSLAPAPPPLHTHAQLTPLPLPSAQSSSASSSPSSPTRCTTTSPPSTACSA